MGKKNMIKMFNKLNYKHSIWEVYTDFLEIAALSINTAAQIQNKEKNDKKYEQITKRYTKEEMNIFCDLFKELIITLDEKQTDVLGEIFMELELGSKWKGQFFTPYDVCLMTVRLTLNDIDETIKRRGYLSLNEPCCGGGAMIIAAAEVMKEKGYNPQQQLAVICQDLDLKAVHMAYIQLSLIGIPAVIYHMNTLSLETYSEWKTPFWVLFNWDYKFKRK